MMIRRFTDEVRMVPVRKTVVFTAVVVEVTPLTSEVMTLPDEETVLLPITVLVADTPR